MKQHFHFKNRRGIQMVLGRWEKRCRKSIFLKMRRQGRGDWPGWDLEARGCGTTSLAPVVSVAPVSTWPLGCTPGNWTFCLLWKWKLTPSRAWWEFVLTPKQCTEASRINLQTHTAAVSTQVSLLSILFGSFPCKAAVENHWLLLTHTGLFPAPSSSGGSSVPWPGAVSHQSPWFTWSCLSSLN